LRALLPEIRRQADACERARSLSGEILAGLVEAGVFRLCIPRALGGSEADVATLAATLEEIAAADGSTGWCAMIGATSGLVAGYLEEATAHDIYGSPDVVTAGVFAPRGTARRDGRAYVVSGRWPFASGCRHAGWLMGGCLVVDGEGPTHDAAGKPCARMVLFPAADATIHDTWDAAGLRATGSHDIEVRDLRVPCARSVSLATDAPRATGALYRFPIFGLLAVGIAAVALGIARRALEELAQLAASKVPTGTRRRLAERSAVQADLARAHGAVGGARAYLSESVAAAMDAARDGELDLATRARLRLAATHATRSAAEAVDLMYEAGGATSIYASSPLQRCLRDVHVATQHAMVAPATYELSGRVLLGIPTETSLL